MSIKFHSTAVVGAGPAGLALAAALQGHGVDTVVVDAGDARPWKNRYAVWLDELAGLRLGTTPAAACLAVQWPSVDVRFAAAQSLASTTKRPWQTLRRAYGVFDNHALAHVLGQTLPRIAGRVARVDVTRDGSTLVTDDGAALCTAHVVIDATGSGALSGAPTPTAAQTAYGVVIDVPTARWPRPVLMDYALAFDDVDALRAPSFAYVLPLAADRLFVEETSLCAAPPLSIDTLKVRLQQRLRSMNLLGARVVDDETCVIPLPDHAPKPRRMFAFGAAAAAVNPATGYSVSDTLRRAEPVAARIARELASGAAPVDVAAAAWQELWPAKRRRLRELQSLGMHVLLQLDLLGLREFFGAWFYSGDVEQWAAMMRSDIDPAQLTAAMSAVFSRLSHEQRLLLSREAVLRHPRSVFDLTRSLWRLRTQRSVA